MRGRKNVSKVRGGRQRVVVEVVEEENKKYLGIHFWEHAYKYIYMVGCRQAVGQRYLLWSRYVVPYLAYHYETVPLINCFS